MQIDSDIRFTMTNEVTGSRVAVDMVDEGPDFILFNVQPEGCELCQMQAPLVLLEEAGARMSELLASGDDHQILLSTMAALYQDYQLWKGAFGYSLAQYLQAITLVPALAAAIH